MQEIDRLQRTHHHLEMRDATILIESDEVDAVHCDAFDLGLEFENGALLVAPLAAIGEVWPAQNLVGAGEIFERDVAAALWRVHDGTFKDGVGMQQLPER